MNQPPMLRIQIPASTANLGPGFDSLGMALGLYLTIEASQSDRWEVIIDCKELQGLPGDESNYLVRMAQKAAAFYGAEMPPCRLKVKSDIPLARGLGSSASAIVAGIELANAFCSLKLDEEEKMRFAAIEEGHPDNVGAAIYGGLAVGIQGENGAEVVSLPVVGVAAVVVIPAFELKTEQSRSVLPSELAFGQAVSASAASNTFVAAVCAGNWALAGQMMEMDQFHEPYRAKLMPYFADVRRIAKEYGAYGTAVSGAGPTILSIANLEKVPAIYDALQASFPDMSVHQVQLVNHGPVVRTIK